MSCKHFQCKKCGSEYHSPIKVSDVLCPTCSNKGRAEVWMQPKESA